MTFSFWKIKFNLKLYRSITSHQYCKLSTKVEMDGACDEEITKENVEGGNCRGCKEIRNGGDQQLIEMRGGRT